MLVDEAEIIIRGAQPRLAWGRWADLLRTQLDSFKPLYAIPDYSSKYGDKYPN